VHSDAVAGTNSDAKGRRPWQRGVKPKSQRQILQVVNEVANVSIVFRPGSRGRSFGHGESNGSADVRGLGSPEASSRAAQLRFSSFA